MKARIKDLLTDEEIGKLSPVSHIDVNANAEDLSIKQLNEIGWAIIRTKYSGDEPLAFINVPKLGLETLQKRAIHKGLAIFWG